MKRGIIITFEGLPETVLESQAIVHAKEVASIGVDLEIWTFDVFTTSYIRSIRNAKEMENKYGIRIRISRGFRPSWPFSEIFNAVKLILKLYCNKYDCEIIRARGDYGTVVAGIARILKKFELIWDCRGDSYAEFFTRNNQQTGMIKVLVFGYAQMIRLREILAQKFCNRAIFISDGLRKKKTGKKFLKSYDIIPCSASENLFYFDPNLREKTRSALGYQPNDIVLIYSGSINYYQCFDETIKLIRNYMKFDSNIKFILLTPQKKQALEYIYDLPFSSWQIKSVALEEVNRYLNVADFGLFLRKRISLNLVASPVKFAEYCLSGLSVIMSDGVEQSRQLADSFGNLIYYNWKKPPELHPVDDAHRLQIAKSAMQILGQRHQLNIFRKVYLNQ